MRTILLEGTNGRVEATYPTKEDILGVFVGGFAPNCFGRCAVVSRITARQQDMNGKWFVCYYTKTENGEMSCSLKQDEILRSVSLCNAFTSAAIDDAERQARTVIAIRIETPEMFWKSIR